MWIELLQDAEKLRLDGFIVADHFLIRASAAGGLGFQVSQDCDGFAGTCDDQRRMPGEAGPIDQRQDRVRHGAGFTDKGHPQINLFFRQDGDGLPDFFLNESAH